MADSKRSERIVTATGSVVGKAKISGFAQIFTKPAEDSPIYSLVGCVAAEWSELERCLDEIIWRLAEISPPLGACLTSQMIGHFPRFNAILALLTANGRSRELSKAVEVESGKVSILAERRARTVHDAWYVDLATGEGHQFRSRPRKTHAFGIQPSTQADLEKLLLQIKQRLTGIIKLSGQISPIEPLP